MILPYCYNQSQTENIVRSQGMVRAMMKRMVGCIGTPRTSKFSGHFLLSQQVQPFRTSSPSAISNAHESTSNSRTSPIHAYSCVFLLFSTVSTKSKSAHIDSFNRVEASQAFIRESCSSRKFQCAHLHKDVESFTDNSSPVGNTHLCPAPSIPKEPTAREKQFEKWVQNLQRGFKPEDVAGILEQQSDVDLAFDIYQWATQQRRYKHNHVTYRIMIQKLASAKMFEKMETLIEEVMAGACAGSESLFNTIIYIYIQTRKLGKAINVFKHMQKAPDCKPALKTYNILLNALVGKGTNSYVSHMYMATIRTLFKQMIAADVAPDTFTLNVLIKGYSKSLHMNDALRIFHQMDLYGCSADVHTFNYLIRGLSVQGRTINAMTFYRDMLSRGFVPSNMVYNSLINSLSINGELQEACRVLVEMASKGGIPDFLTCKTLVDGMCREGKVEAAEKLLYELRNKYHALDGMTYRKLLNNLQLRSVPMDGTD